MANFERIPDNVPFGTGALQGGKVGVKVAKKKQTIPIEDAGQYASMLLLAAHHASRMLPSEPQLPHPSLNKIPPAPLWATSLSMDDSSKYVLHLTVGKTVLGFEMTGEQCERLGQALIAASVPKSRPQ